MTNKEACEPCAKRKVRCDKQEPCSNCKRRKSDRCVYPIISPNDRIRRLEALVRKLGGDPSVSGTNKIVNPPSQAIPRSSTTDPASNPQEARPIEVRSEDPVVLEEDGQSFYLESRRWQGWVGNVNHEGGSTTSNRNPFLMRKRPHALSGNPVNHDRRDHDSGFPSPQHAYILWDTFINRVEPLVRTSYRWNLSLLRTKSTDLELRQQLSDAENALVSAIYYISASSLRDEECNNIFQQSRSSLISQQQAICEESMLRTNLLCINDVLVVKAIIFYMMASYDRLSIQSLWSLMGLTVRNAERLGLHRDGLVLGLSPAETEERRRVWWQLQHVDLALAVWGGLTPMTLMADWDAKIPSNIEDDDISPTSTEIPKERRGLTSMSHCRFTYWVLDQQRKIFQVKQGRFTLSWQLTTTLSPELKENVISQLENSVNQEFIQYCDPLQPLHTLLQLVARALFVGMRMRVLHASTYEGEKQQVSEQNRTALLETSMQSLRYTIAVHSHESLKQYKWYTIGFFSWHAFMFVLVEASRETDISKAQETWRLLADVYESNRSLLELEADRRKHHAAELVVTAWKTWRNKFGSDQQTAPPQFVVDLENKLALHRARVNQQIMSEMTLQTSVQQSAASTAPESFMTEEDLSGVFDLDFQNIDWSFWSSMD